MGRIFLFGCLLFFCQWGNAQSWKNYYDSAVIAGKEKQAGRSIYYYGEALEMLPVDSLNTQTYIQFHRESANQYLSLGRVRDAIALFIKIGDALEQVNGRDALYVSNAEMLGQLYANTDILKAIQYFTEAQEAKEKLYGVNSLEYAASCNALGIMYNRMGELEQALEFHSKARSIRAELKGRSDPQYAQSCNNMATVYRVMGEYEKAEGLALEALAIRSRLQPEKHHRDYAITCTNLANIYRDIGQYQKARGLYIEAKDIRAVVVPEKATEDYAAACNILADLYAYMKEYDLAEPLYIEAKNIREKNGKDTRAYAQSCNNLGSLYRDKGDYKKAEQMLLEVREIFDRILTPKDPDMAISLNGLGELYFDMGRYEHAKKYFLQAREQWKKDLGDNHPYYIQSLANLGKLYWNTGEKQRTNELFKESFDAQYSTINKIFRFTSEAEKQQYLKNITGAGDEYRSFYFLDFDHNDAGQSYNISLRNRNLILSSLQEVRKIVFESKDSVLEEKYEEWIIVKQDLAKMHARVKPASSQKLKAQEENADKLEKELSKRSAAFQRSQKAVEWKHIRQSLAGDEVAIEFIEFTLFDGRRWTDTTMYAAVIIGKNMQQPKLVSLFEEKQLIQLLSKKSRSRITSINMRYGSDSLYDLVWKPLEKHLVGIRKINFAAAGLLHQVPLAALRSGDKLLSDKYELVQMLTTAAVVDPPSDDVFEFKKFVLYGDVQYEADSIQLKQVAAVLGLANSKNISVPAEITRGGEFSHWGPLPGSGQEIDSISSKANARHFRTVKLKGLDANEESLKMLNGDSLVSVLHFATHGFFYPDPAVDKQAGKTTGGTVFKQSENPLLRSGLVMAGGENTWRGKPVEGVEDGILTAYEVSSLYLPATRLVVLSACQTGLGDIQGSEGVYGLQRAFKIAGVRYLLMSLWEVQDDVTFEFMQFFYNNMLDAGSVAAAFLKAQTTMKNKYRFEPYKWAAWILVR